MKTRVAALRLKSPVFTTAAAAAFAAFAFAYFFFA